MVKPKFPLCEVLGLKITTKLETDYTGAEKTVVNYISAEGLEEILQKAKQIYFNRRGETYFDFKTDRGLIHNKSGLIIGEVNLVHCIQHITIQNPDKTYKCQNCNIPMKATFAPEESE